MKTGMTKPEQRIALRDFMAYRPSIVSEVVSF